jgi:hypothetical protein
MEENVRPIKDKIGFCWDRKEMESFIEFLSNLDQPKIKKK